MNNYQLILINSTVLFLLFVTGCVGPPEAEYGLVENFPVVINTQNLFTYSLNGDKYSSEDSVFEKIVLLFFISLFFLSGFLGFVFSG